MDECSVLIERGPDRAMILVSTSREWTAPFAPGDETMTAAITNYLIESVSGRVDLCQSQGGQWITIRRDITTEDAERVGFNLDAPPLRAVFTDAAHFHGARGPRGD